MSFVLSKEYAAMRKREALVREMAEHIVAGVSSGGLCTASDMEVIAYLYDAPERYHHRLVLEYKDDAVVLAKQILDAMGRS